jgi:hypothetical protein
VGAILIYEYVPDIAERRAPHRQTNLALHLDHLQSAVPTPTSTEGDPVGA